MNDQVLLHTPPSRHGKRWSVRVRRRVPLGTALLPSGCEVVVVRVRQRPSNTRKYADALLMHSSGSAADQVAVDASRAGNDALLK